MPIESITIYNRTDGELGRRLSNFTLTRARRRPQGSLPRGAHRRPAPSKAIRARRAAIPVAAVRQAAMDGADVTSAGRRPKTFQSLAPFVQRAERTARPAIRALQRIPRGDWPKDEARPLLDALVGSSSASFPPPSVRPPRHSMRWNSPTRWPRSCRPPTASAVRAELGELGVRVIRIGTLFERMAYDKDMIAVRAGKPVEFVFENTDLMPHNFVITEPGSLEEIGQIAEATAQQPDAARRHFVPQSRKVLLASTLLQPRPVAEAELHRADAAGRLSLRLHLSGPLAADVRRTVRRRGSRRLPGEPGSVPRGASACRSRTSCSRIAARAPSGSSTIWPRRSTTLEAGRSYGNGKQLVPGGQLRRLPQAGRRRHRDRPRPRQARCQVEARRHAQGAARSVGQDQREVSDVHSHARVGQDADRPGAGGNNRRRQGDRESAGQGRAGRDQAREIIEREKAAVSIMPKGLLDKLSREEILDLVAYVAARGNPQHPFFQGGHNHAPGPAGKKVDPQQGIDLECGDLSPLSFSKPLGIASEGRSVNRYRNPKRSRHNATALRKFFEHPAETSHRHMCLIGNSRRSRRIASPKPDKLEFTLMQYQSTLDERNR